MCKDFGFWVTLTNNIKSCKLKVTKGTMVWTCAVSPEERPLHVALRKHLVWIYDSFLMTGNLHVENNFVGVQVTRPSLTSAIVIKEGGAMHWLRFPLWTRVRVTALALDLNSCVSSCKSLNHSVNVCVKLKWKYVKCNCINSKMYIPHLMCIIYQNPDNVHRSILYKSWCILSSALPFVWEPQQQTPLS